MFIIIKKKKGRNNTRRVVCPLERHCMLNMYFILFQVKNFSNISIDIAKFEEVTGLSAFRTQQIIYFLALRIIFSSKPTFCTPRQSSPPNTLYYEIKCKLFGVCIKYLKHINEAVTHKKKYIIRLKKSCLRWENLTKVSYKKTSLEYYFLAINHIGQSNWAHMPAPTFSSITISKRFSVYLYISQSISQNLICLFWLHFLDVDLCIDTYIDRYISMLSVYIWVFVFMIVIQDSLCLSMCAPSFNFSVLSLSEWPHVLSTFCNLHLQTCINNVS